MTAFHVPYWLVAVVAFSIIAVIAIIAGVIVGLVRKDAHRKGQAR